MTYRAKTKKLLIFFLTLAFLFIVNGLRANDKPQFDFKNERNSHYASEFMRYYNEGKQDSVALTLRLWEAETGMNEVAFRAYALHLISNNDFPGHLVYHDLLENAIAWEIRYDLIFDKEKDKDDYFQTHPSFFSYIPIGSEFDQFSINAARTLIKQLDEETLAYAFARLYAGDVDDFFQMISEGKYSNTIIADEYNEKLEELYKLPETHLAINFGSWIPQSSLSVVGLKPSLGLKLGRWYSRFRMDLSFNVRFGDAANAVDIPLTDTLMLEVKNFIGGRAAIEASYNVFNSQPSSIDFFIGGGYEWIEMVKSGQDRRGKVFTSPTVSSGFIYRYFFPNRMSIGIATAYHMLWFENPGGTAFDGNAFSIALQIGLSENPKKKIGLNRFGIKYW